MEVLYAFPRISSHFPSGMSETFTYGTGEVEGLRDLVEGFYYAVDWTEPWIMAMGAFHVITFTLFLATRHHQTAQLILWVNTCM